MVCISGAELFAKRRKKSEKWVVDENNVKTTSSFSESYQSNTYQNNYQTNSYQSNNYQSQSLVSPGAKLPPPSYLKSSTQRVENVQKMNEIQVSYLLEMIDVISMNVVQNI